MVCCYKMNYGYRRCSSCKLLLPISFFYTPNNSTLYKTCMTCRDKKHVKYYGTVHKKSSKRGHRKQSQKLPDGSKCVRNKRDPAISSIFNSTQSKVNDTTVFTVPYSTWIVSNAHSHGHVIVASVIVNPMKIAKFYSENYKRFP